MAHKRIPPHVDAIWRRAQLGDAESEACLVEIYRYLIPQIVKTDDPDLRDEAESEALLALIRGIRKFDPSRGAAPQTYIATCIHHAVGKIYARRARDLDLLESLDAIQNDEGEFGPESYIDPAALSENQILDRIALIDIVEGLPERDRRIVSLYAAGWTVTEIAAEIGVCRAWCHDLINAIRARVDRQGSR